LLASAIAPTASAGRHGPRAGQEPYRALLLLCLGLATVLTPYLILNLALSGQPFPSTLYAKQTEYRVLLEQPIWRRLWVVARRPLVGAQVLLIPGFLWQAYATLRQALRSIQPDQAGVDAGQIGPEGPHPLAALLPIAWWAATHLLYALRLPVDYQHGRYLIPTLPVLIVYGMTGTLHWMGRTAQGARGEPMIARVWPRALVGALVALALAFLLLGGQSYAEDRCVIRREMVDVALWLRDHTPPGALVAAHDIGAIGYWAQRPLLDLAGLITPEVIPVMRDQARLLEYVLDREADYLVTFPSWYPELVQDARLSRLYPSQAESVPPQSRDRMTVYRIGTGDAAHQP
jgi:hypothetical protein